MRTLYLGLTLLAAAANASEATHGRFVVLSDIHAYAPADGGPSPHPQSVCPANGAACDSCVTPIQQDTYAPLFESLMQDLACTQSGQTDFVIVSGDWIAHAYGHGSGQQDEKKAIIETVTQRLQAQFGAGTLLIPALGNNDAYQGDYNIQPDGQFLQDVMALWQPLFPAGAHLGTCADGLSSTDEAKAFKASFLAGGYYAFQNPLLPSNCTLVLNTVLFMQNYLSSHWGSNGPDAGKVQMKWLDARLAEASAKNVWVVFHVPSGVDSYGSYSSSSHISMQFAPEFSQPFVDLMRKSGAIEASFAGHSHMDTFRLYRDDQGQPTAWLHITPSVTPWNHKGRSAYQWFEYDIDVTTDRTVIRDYRTRHLVYGSSASWAEEYSWKAEFCPTCDYDASTLDKVVAAVSSAGSKEEKAFRRIYQEWSPSDPAGLSSAQWPYVRCALANLNRSDYCDCLGLGPPKCPSS